MERKPEIPYSSIRPDPMASEDNGGSEEELSLSSQTFFL